MSSLPQEILDKIVGHVDTNLEPEHLFQSFPTHRNLALTARCFVHASYSRIYEKVKFRHEALMSFGRPSTAPSYKKRVNFEVHPRLIKYIRHVEVSAPLACPRRNRCGEMYRSFASIARRLTKVQKVQLHSSRVGRWEDVPMGCRKTIEHLLSTNPVTELAVSNIAQFPLDAILLASSLDTVTVSHHASVSGGFSCSRDREWRLTSYTHRSSSASALGALFSPQFPSLYASLTRLDVSITSIEAHHDAWSTLLSDRGHPMGLRALRLAYGESTSRQRLNNLVSMVCHDMLDTAKSLPYFQLLTSLSLELVSGEQEMTVSFPSSFPHFLNQLLSRNSQPSLTTLQILMRLDSSTCTPSLPHASTNSSPLNGWAALDGVLSSQEKFPNISEIRLEPWLQCRLSNQLFLGAQPGDMGVRLTARTGNSPKDELLSLLPETASRIPGLTIDVGESKLMCWDPSSLARID